MKNLKNEVIKTMATTVRSIKGWRGLFALGLAAAFVAVSALGPTSLALADSGGAKGHTFDVTFTKWITSLPANPLSSAGVSMAGVVGGAVGDGRYAGEILSDNLSVPGFWLGHARYEIYGERHSFIADLHITENDTTDPATATITGVVTRGWLKGARVTGEYTVMAVCPIVTPGNVYAPLCYQGTLHIHRGSE